MRSFLALLPLALLAAHANAAIVVQQLKPAQGYVVLKTSGSDALTQGEVLDAPQGGQPCKMKIYFVKGNWAGATIKECPAASGFSVGQEISLAGGGAATQEEEQPAKNEEEKPQHEKSRSRREEAERVDSSPAKFHHVGVHAYYSMATTLNEKYSYSGDTGNSPVPLTTVDGAYASSGALGLGARYTFIKRYPKPNKELHLGGMAALNYEFPRKLEQFKPTSGADPTDYTSLTYKLTYFEANFMAEYNGFYGLLGPNYSIVTVEGADANQDFNYSGAIGMQLGAGYTLGKFGIEALYRVINGKITSALIGVDATSEQERLAGLQLRVRYDFDI